VAVTEQNRIPAVKLGARQTPETTSRRDKTGGRTFVGLPNAIRKKTAYELSTFMMAWNDPLVAPTHGPLFQAGMGGSPIWFAGGTVAATDGVTSVTFSAAHGLVPGQGVTSGGDLRFVAGVLDAVTVFVNAPFTLSLAVGAVMGPTITYPLAHDLGSVSIFDYWDPVTAVQRILHGAAVDRMRITVNGDFHEFGFEGPARDLLDSTSFSSGLGALTAFPAEPLITGFDYTVVPGHLGQVWMGTTATQFLTLTEAQLVMENNIEPRVREFGSDVAQCITAGVRSVKLNFSVFEEDDAATQGLYQAARQRSAIGVMLQLGQQSTQLLGAYMPAMVPEVPEFDDGETRLQWRFQSGRAQGTVNDELYIAFG